jgi:hypothetical protein
MTAGVWDEMGQGGTKWESVVYSGVGVEPIGDVVGPSAPPASASSGDASPGGSLADTGAFLSEHTMETCSECRWWNVFPPDFQDPNDPKELGECRRRSPERERNEYSSRAEWPTTDGGDWCGEFVQWDS